MPRKSRGKLVGFCEKCKKETPHKYKKDFLQLTSGRNKGQFELDEWHECATCGNKISEESETLRYI